MIYSVSKYDILFSKQMFDQRFHMRNIILNPTKRQVHKINKRIEEVYRPRQKQALIVFTTNISNNTIYTISLDTFPALGTGISMTMVSEIPVDDISKEQYILLLCSLFSLEKITISISGFTPKQVRWFQKNLVPGYLMSIQRWIGGES